MINLKINNIFFCFIIVLVFLKLIQSVENTNFYCSNNLRKNNFNKYVDLVTKKKSLMDSNDPSKNTLYKFKLSLGCEQEKNKPTNQNQLCIDFTYFNDDVDIESIINYIFNAVYNKDMVRRMLNHKVFEQETELYGILHSILFKDLINNEYLFKRHIANHYEKIMSSSETTSIRLKFNHKCHFNDESFLCCSLSDELETPIEKYIENFTNESFVYMEDNSHKRNNFKNHRLYEIDFINLKSIKPNITLSSDYSTEGIADQYMLQYINLTLHSESSQSILNDLNDCITSRYDPKSIDKDNNIMLLKYRYIMRRMMNDKYENINTMKDSIVRLQACTFNTDYYTHMHKKIIYEDAKNNEKVKSIINDIISQSLMKFIESMLNVN